MKEKEEQPVDAIGYYDEYEIDLREYIKVLWDGKWIIIGLFIIAVLAAGIISQYFIAPVYEAEAEFLAPSFTLLDGEQLSSSEYLSFFQKTKLKEQVAKKFNLKEKNPNFSVEDLDEISNFQMNEDSSLVTIQLKQNESQLAADILNYWLGLFQRDVIEFINKQNNTYLNSLKSSMVENSQKYENVLSEWTSFQKGVNLELLNSQLQNKQKRLVNIESKIADLKTEIEALKLEYETVSSLLSDTEKIIVTKEGISEKSLRKLRAIIKEKEVLDNLVTENEQLNPQYSNLANTKDNLKKNLTTSKSRLNSLTEEVNSLQDEIHKLQDKVAGYKQKKELLQERLDTARDNYQSSKEAYSQAKQKMSQKNYQISIVDEAVIPQKPISPNKKLNVAIAGVLSLMLGIFIVFFKEFMSEVDVIED